MVVDASLPDFDMDYMERRPGGLFHDSFIHSEGMLSTSGLFQFGPQLVADRYSYITTLPLAVLAGALFREGLARRREASLAAAAALVAALAVACVRDRVFQVFHPHLGLVRRIAERRRGEK